MNLPLFNLMNELGNKQNISFNMPSHSQGLVDYPMFACSKFDFSEIGCNDNLQNPTSAILQAETLMAKAHNAIHSLFVSTGATTAIQISLLMAKQLGLEVIVLDNAHKSITCACEVFGIKIHLAKTIHEQLSLAKQIKNNACFCTSPNYFGQTQCFKILKPHTQLLIVDEAHGSHFMFSPLLPCSAVDYADLVINSYHKTMPCLTGGAVLHILRQDLKSLSIMTRQAIHTTSPNYLILSSLDFARGYMQENGETLFAKIHEEITAFKLMASKLGYTFLKNEDFSRIVLFCDSQFVSKELKKANIYCELAVEDKLVLIINPFNYKQLPILYKHLKNIKYNSPHNGTNDLLPEAMPKAIHENLHKGTKKGIQEDLQKNKISGSQKSQRNANCENASKNDLDLVSATQNNNQSIVFMAPDLCVGRILANDIGTYPPAVPVLLKGCKLTQENIEYIHQNKDKLFGLVAEEIAVTKE